MVLLNDKIRESLHSSSKLIIRIGTAFLAVIVVIIFIRWENKSENTQSESFSEHENMSESGSGIENQSYENKGENILGNAQKSGKSSKSSGINDNLYFQSGDRSRSQNESNTMGSFTRENMRIPFFNSPEIGSNRSQTTEQESIKNNDQLEDTKEDADEDEDIDSEYESGTFIQKDSEDESYENGRPVSSPDKGTSSIRFNFDKRGFDHLNVNGDTVTPHVFGSLHDAISDFQLVTEFEETSEEKMIHALFADYMYLRVVEKVIDMMTESKVIVRRLRENIIFDVTMVNIVAFHWKKLKEEEEKIEKKKKKDEERKKEGELNEDLSEKQSQEVKSVEKGEKETEKSSLGTLVYEIYAWPMCVWIYQQLEETEDLEYLDELERIDIMEHPLYDTEILKKVLKSVLELFIDKLTQKGENFLCKQLFQKDEFVVLDESKLNTPESVDESVQNESMNKSPMIIFIFPHQLEQIKRQFIYEGEKFNFVCVLVIEDGKLQSILKNQLEIEHIKTINECEPLLLCYERSQT